MFAFADSVTPQLINPAEFSHVAAYVNGRFAWSPAQVKRFPRHIMIGVLPGAPVQARVARCLDMERFDASAADFPAFVGARADAGHDDALGYTSILGGAPGEGIEAIVSMMTGEPDPWQLWVAWWWGRPFPPTAAEVLAEIKALTGVVLPVGRLAGCQWRNAPALDTSVWYGRDTFTAAGQ